MTDTALLFSAPPVPTLAIRGRVERFPVNRIFCIGRNYAAHAREMGHDPDREPPFFFLKPRSALAEAGSFRLPATSSDVHHEVELVAALSTGGRGIAVSDALNCVFGYCVGLDMTQRDLQTEAKKLGRPWDLAKGFDGSAPCGEIVPAAAIGHPTQGTISLSVDGKERQTGDLNQMIWSLPEIISILSRAFTLSAGDLIMTGTPAGVGPVAAGEALSAHIEGVGALEVKVLAAKREV